MKLSNSCLIRKGDEITVFYSADYFKDDCVCEHCASKPSAPTSTAATPSVASDIEMDATLSDVQITYTREQRLRMALSAPTPTLEEQAIRFLFNADTKRNRAGFDSFEKQ